MSKIIAFFKNGHIQMSMALGFSIIILGHFSKRVLPVQIDSLILAIPGFFMVSYEVVKAMKKKTRFNHQIYWILGILISTTLIIAYYMVRYSYKFHQ